MKYGTNLMARYVIVMHVLVRHERERRVMVINLSVSCVRARHGKVYNRKTCKESI
jgi:hypothetical protein